MTPIELVIEGEGAVSAAAELLREPDIEGFQEPLDASGKREPITLAAVATIVSIAGGTISGVSGLVSLAEKIHQWYSKRKQTKEANKITKVLLIGSNGKRLLLEGATPEQIRKVLEP
ncbi:hypothetical protein [Gloeobacter kilaueensis]|uniref:Uncharacterized protein n=1 Tax=Gloeobacter kilaueensis (strain ATCC BAA-2537 / CCAP 1431/1 / ULC 316 / JS1) TaxID=1183438 RepID=U5QKI7_GLOK1|nr:hypothetical protein [Gloeobacter kilaueensis]AGY59492.1 hypothetical protein GKIL_3246 [Gloeobacter kilaueensis JS1]